MRQVMSLLQNPVKAAELFLWADRNRLAAGEGIACGHAGRRRSDRPALSAFYELVFSLCTQGACGCMVFRRSFPSVACRRGGAYTALGPAPGWHDRSRDIK